MCSLASALSEIESVDVIAAEREEARRSTTEETETETETEEEKES